jgi:predicted PurR-regulated permease PerM
MGCPLFLTKLTFRMWSAFLSFCLSAFLSFCLSAFLPFCLSVFLSFCLSASLSFCHSVILSFCLSVFLSFCLSAFLSFCLSVFLSFYYNYAKSSIKLCSQKTELHKVQRNQKSNKWKKVTHTTLVREDLSLILHPNSGWHFFGRSHLPSFRQQT